MNCGKFIGELFRARDIAHVEHLLANSKAAHELYEELYDGLIEHLDTIAELRLSRGTIEITIPEVESGVNVVEYLEEELLPMIDMAKDKMDSKGWNDISAEVDVLKATVNRILYKLTRLVDDDKLGEYFDEFDNSTDVDERYDDGGKTNKSGKPKTMSKSMTKIQTPRGGILVYKNKCGGGKIKK
jgi:hypothetical protein